MKNWKTLLPGCLLFLSIPIITSPELSRGLGMFRVPAFQYLFSYFVLLTLFFFWNSNYLLKLFFERNHKVYFGLLFVAFGLLIWLPNQMVYLIEIIEIQLGIQRNFDPELPNIPNIAKLVPYLFVVTTSYMFTLKQMLDEATNEKLKAEISYLKAQINPHFLFNTLNSIYALTIMKSDDAPKAVLGLSGLMRYVVNESSNDFVGLEKEITYLENFIELQRLRIGNVTPIQVVIKGDFNGKSITPLLLIPIIENAFKYGINPDKESFISIRIALQDNHFHLHVQNAKVNTVLDETQKTETGLQNISKRLQYFYPSRHELIIRDLEHVFDVILNIQLA
jgi:hypothetical protein